MTAPRRKSMLARIGIRGDRDGGQTGPDLDEEMEKVFAMSEGERFDLARFSKQSESLPNPEQRHYDEKDYSFHRKKNYPHMHVPIKIMHSRSMRKRPIVRDSQEGAENSEARKDSQGDHDSDSKLSPPQRSVPSVSTSVGSPEVEEEGEVSRLGDEDLLSSESEALISDRAADYHAGYGTSPDRKVQFDIDDLHGAAEEDEEVARSKETPLEEREKKSKRKQSESSINASSPEVEGGLGDSTAQSSESETPVSERDIVYDIPELVISPDRRVQFDVEGELNEQDEEADYKKRDESEELERKGKRKHGRYHKFRKYSMPEETVWRKRSGAFLGVHERKFSIQPEEASTLEEMDQDDLASHRFDIPRGKRRYSVKSKISVASFGTESRKNSVAPQGLPIYGYKKAFDHSPHKVFVQLNELIGFGDEREWKETARWIKYEENVEEGADRWGRPHVASLSFHSLLNLRRCLTKGVVLLDLEEKDLPGIVYRVVEQMVIDELIMPEDKASLMRALLLRHRHVDTERFRFHVRRNTASYTSLQNLQEEAKTKPKIVTSGSNLEVPKIFNNHHHFDDNMKLNLFNHTSVDMKEETYMSSSEDLTKKAAKESILKRIPAGAEATAVLVGAVDFLKQPTIAFVRLAEGTIIPSVTEVTIPVRFLFILLGPLTAELDYHEIGRSISTLMSISDFHTLAYKATERSDLLIAINEFLDYSIVLPPGDWQTKALLPFAELKAKNDAIRRRQSRVQDAAKLETKALLIEAEKEKKPPYPDPLKRTKRPFGGLLNDIKRRFPFYISDLKDGINAQCFAAAIFIYFAALSAAITFGGLMADKTNNLVGIAETLVATSGAGIIFSILAGQPLVIVGTTGPLLLFDESLYNFCQANQIEYLTIRVYIGFWLACIALVVGWMEGSVFVKLFTRFISEIFASLISLLYIIESAQKVFMVFVKHPLMTLTEYCMEANNTATMYSAALLQAPSINSTFQDDLEMNGTLILAEKPKSYSASPANEPNTALFCLILALGTFYIAYYLRQFRNSKFLGRSARRALGDFGVPIAIVAMVLGDYIVPGIYTEKLKVPEGLSPSNPMVRGWVISPLGLLQPIQAWVAFAACIPAMLVYILLFMETHISELIIDKKDRKLKKGSGFHLDIVLICLINVGCGLLGAPFMCAATVRSVAHVSAVTVMSRTHAPGDKPHIIEVKEQRLSALVVSILVGASVLMSPLLRLVPMAVLFGVFLYMGISSIDGIQFFERLRLFFMPVKHHEADYVRRVRTMKMHLFTIIQFSCLGILWIVKSSSFSLAFPFFLILMVPLRAQFCYIFTPAELRALDSDEPDADAQEDEPDFYAESLLAG